MSVIKIVLATSSPITLAQLSRSLGACPTIALLAKATSLARTYVLVEQHEPQLVLMGTDLEQHPDFEGILALFRLMGVAWMRISAPSWPQTGAAQGPGRQVASLDPELGVAAQIALIKAAILAAPKRAAPDWPMAPSRGTPGLDRPNRLILIGSSTGGIEALLRVLSGFPVDCPPTAIVQHTGPAFSDSLIRLLNRACPAQVVPAQNGVMLQRGTVVIGAGCKGHFVLQSGPPPQARVVPGPAISGHCPAVDALFQSAIGMATTVTAALLTGMGRDGAQGMLALRRAGARTLAQDEESSVVYGMPRAAWEIGAAQDRLPLDRISAELLASPPRFDPHQTG
ncbi:MAG: CheB methylesterase domain-containing protein [Paracoccaceae bacterium]